MSSPHDEDLTLEQAIIQELLYFSTHLPFKDTDDIAIVLKGHMIVEEQLIAFVHCKLERPEKIKQFSFARYLGLAEALTPQTQYDWIFEACRKLNRIRNEMSHQLTPADIEKLIHEFTAHVKNSGGVMLDPLLVKCNLPEFRTAVLALYAALRNFDRPIGLSLRIQGLIERVGGS